jgi:hypothetical protein
MWTGEIRKSRRNKKSGDFTGHLKSPDLILPEARHRTPIHNPVGLTRFQIPGIHDREIPYGSRAAAKRFS